MKATNMKHTSSKLNGMNMNLPSLAEELRGCDVIQALPDALDQCGIARNGAGIQ